MRNMGLDEIFGSEYAFLSERVIIHQTAQAADYIVFSGDLLYSSISDRHVVSHVWRLFSARSVKAKTECQRKVVIFGVSSLLR